MKKILYLFVVTGLLFSCQDGKKANKKGEKEEVKKESKKIDGLSSFGAEINSKDAIAYTDMLGRFQSLKKGDTISAKFISSINDVCTKKGCWMKLKLDDNQETMVRFKDYGFFMPLDSKGKEVIVEGKAFVKEVSVDEQRHYAEDAGESKEAIAAITEPKKTYSFEADGVLIKK